VAAARLYSLGLDGAVSCWNCADFTSGLTVAPITAFTLGVHERANYSVFSLLTTTTPPVSSAITPTALSVVEAGPPAEGLEGPDTIIVALVHGRDVSLIVVEVGV
jgi:hypothetical protein